MTVEERKQERVKQWKKAHPEKVAEQQKRYRERHPDKISVYKDAWYQRNKERVCAKALSRYHSRPDVRVQQRKGQIVSAYGISPEKYEDLLCEQGGCCAMCGKKFNREDRNAPHIDHNHLTGDVRGLLCRECNVGLGWLEKPGFIEKALAYMNR